MKLGQKLMIGLVFTGWALLYPKTSEGSVVPLELQVALFKKIIMYDHTLQNIAPADLRLLVLNGGQDVVRAFAKVGFTATVVTEPELQGVMTSAHVIYLASASGAESARRLCGAYKVLSLGAEADLAVSADAAIAIGVRADGKPEIVVNLKRLQADGHSLPAGLLSLARVIR